MNRRGFLTGVAGFLAAPAIVRASSIMPVSAPKVWTWEQGPIEAYTDLNEESLRWAIKLIRQQARMKSELFGLKPE